MSAQPADVAQKRKNATIIAMLGLSIAFGIVNVAMNPQVMQQPGLTLSQIVANLSLFVLGFYWLHIDSTQLDIRRPLWLNAGIVLLAIVFVPYYLHKTRPAGARLVPILSFFGLVLAIGMASAIGSMLMLAMQPGAASPPGI